MSKDYVKALENVLNHDVSRSFFAIHGTYPFDTDQDERQERRNKHTPWNYLTTAQTESVVA